MLWMPVTEALLGGTAFATHVIFDSSTQYGNIELKAVNAKSPGLSELHGMLWTPVTEALLRGTAFATHVIFDSSPQYGNIELKAVNAKSPINIEVGPSFLLSPTFEIL